MYIIVLTVWGYAPLCHLNRIQRLQNRIARIITTNFNFDVSPLLLLTQLHVGLMNVIQRGDYFMLLLHIVSLRQWPLGTLPVPVGYRPCHTQLLFSGPGSTWNHYFSYIKNIIW